ncbi:MAG: acyl-CoA thioesterase [Deltaproteobacteria bacterium]|nr:MAG: acyl-CoA thioesterase [Deltaproteobacteria bacterium]
MTEKADYKEETGHTMLVNRRTLRIEWGQCDPAGIVFYPQYFLIFDSSTGWLFERTGLSPSAMRKKYSIVGMPIVEVGARFVVPCRFDDEVIVESEVSEWGRSSFTVQHRILKKGELALDGFEKRVWAVPHPERTGGIRAQPIPAEIIASLSDDTGMTTVSLAAAGKRESES